MQRAYPEIVSETEKGLYIDDLINCGPTVRAALQVKTVTKILNRGGFTLHKWHSNATELDAISITKAVRHKKPMQSSNWAFPKQRRVRSSEFFWDMEKDTHEVKPPPESAQPTKEAYCENCPEFKTHWVWPNLQH